MFTRPIDFSKYWPVQFALVVLLFAAIFRVVTVEPSTDEEEMLKLIKTIKINGDLVVGMDEFFVDDHEAEAKKALENASSRSTESLIRMLKSDPYPGFNPAVEILGQRDREALPLLLDELKSAEGYYRNILLQTLAGIPCDEQIQVFLDELEGIFEPGEKHFIDVMNAADIIQAFGQQKTKEATPILIRILMQDEIGHEPAPGEHLVHGLRADVRIALNLIGEVNLRNDAGERIEVAQNLRSGLQDGHSEPYSIVEALLDHELIPFDVTIASIQEFESGSTKLKGDIPPEAGTWEVVCGPRKGSRIPVYYEWYTGGLSSAGYVGVLEQVDNQWLVVYWRMIWIS